MGLKNIVMMNNIVHNFLFNLLQFNKISTE